MNGLQILGTGRALPDHITTNDDLAKLVETNDEWIVSRTGIRERRFAREGESLTQFAVEAAQKALDRAGLTPEDIGLCLMATVTPDCITPAQSCLVHQALHLPEDCPAFDLSAGCTGFLYAMETAAALLPRMSRPYALLIGGELLSRIVDMSDRSTCILFGDGVGAAVVKTTEDAPWFSKLGTRGEKDILWAPGPGNHPAWLHMSGQDVFKFALETVPKLARERAPSGQPPHRGVGGQAAEGAAEQVLREHCPLWEYIRGDHPHRPGRDGGAGTAPRRPVDHVPGLRRGPDLGRSPVPVAG